MKSYLTLIAVLFGMLLQAQNASIMGLLQDPDGSAVVYANVALYTADSNLVKVETSDDVGVFRLRNIPAGTYNLSATFVGASELWKMNINVEDNQQLDLGILSFTNTATDLAQATVTATRALVEIKPDRTVLNVQGTINSTGSDALALLRKAPGVTVDNNDNVSVLGRAGVMIYVDGKRLPLTGDDLTNYLQNLPADQIDRIDIITNPGAKYEAQGNAGILDIRLKKDKSLGANGSLSSTYSKGEYDRYNINGSGNYRNKKLNAFATLGYGERRAFMNLNFLARQNNLVIAEQNNFQSDNKNYNYRVGVDYSLAPKHNIGFLIGGQLGSGVNVGKNRSAISQQIQENVIDSILVANTLTDKSHDQSTFNINYRFDNGKGNSLNIDADYGVYKNRSDRFLPNRYFNAAEDQLLSEVINSYDTPTDIDIYTFKLDYEHNLLGGKLGLGGKLSKVISDNTFLVYDIEDGQSFRNDRQSNFFRYDEMVGAAYINFARPINEKWNFTAGLRAEQTDLTGDLQAFLPELQEDPVELSYLNWFPSAGLTWQLAPMHALSLNYGRRINRPDYNVLNPFNVQLSELSFRKGNPRLSPEIVNNMEIGYTLKYRYNFKLAYSKTTNQITRLIAPDDIDPRAGFITWENLASQRIISFNISAPFQVTKGWSSYWNISASHLNNQADYGDGAVVDVQAYSYSFFQQQTIDLPKGFKGEISGYFSGPGVWGGVFYYEVNWSLDLGLQKKFFNDKLKTRLSVSDIFKQAGWNGFSDFSGLHSTGSGEWDSRRLSLSLSYNFGNQELKKAKSRKTGLEDEAGRVGGGN